MDEQNIRDSERYSILEKEIGRHSEGLAGYICIAGFLLLASSFAFGNESVLQPGIGLSCFIGGGGYWLHIRSEQKRIHSEMERIRKSFESRGYQLLYGGSYRRSTLPPPID